MGPGQKRWLSDLKKKKSTQHFSKEPEFVSQHQTRDSQMSLTLAVAEPTLLILLALAFTQIYTQLKCNQHFKITM